MTISEQLWKHQFVQTLSELLEADPASDGEDDFLDLAYHSANSAFDEDGIGRDPIEAALAEYDAMCDRAASER
jgi:hypothetical protein